MVAAVAGLGLLLAACGSSIQRTDPSATYFPATGAATTSTSVSPGVAIASAQVTVTGPVSRPDPVLTPGVVTTTNPNVVCQSPQHQRSHVLELTRAAVYGSYKLRFPDTAHAYSLDYLIPLNLGGSAVVKNIWPAANTGIGFHQKQQLDEHVRAAVCAGRLSLADAQHRIATDWYALWLTYGGA